MHFRGILLANDIGSSSRILFFVCLFVCYFLFDFVVFAFFFDTIFFFLFFSLVGTVDSRFSLPSTSSNDSIDVILEKLDLLEERRLKCENTLSSLPSVPEPPSLNVCSASFLSICIRIRN